MNNLLLVLLCFSVIGSALVLRDAILIKNKELDEVFEQKAKKSKQQLAQIISRKDGIDKIINNKE